MFKKVLYHIYPFITSAIIEYADVLKNIVGYAQTALDIFIVLIQILIGLLTIVKIWKDIRHKRFQSIGKEKQKIAKKHLFLTALLKYLKSNK
jgi:hypothetical protein